MSDRQLFSETTIRRAVFERLLVEGNDQFPGGREVWKSLNHVGVDANAVAMAAAFADGQRDAFEWFRRQIEEEYGITLAGLEPPQPEKKDPEPVYADDEFLKMDHPDVLTE